MLVIKEESKEQICKVRGELMIDTASQEFNSCSGECWDCDSCGGSATH